jgi:hypothetical protein
MVTVFRYASIVCTAIFVLIACRPSVGWRPAIAEAPPRNAEGDSAMTNHWRAIRVVRSGGPMFRPLSATVTFDDGGRAHVVSDVSNQPRELTGPDLALFRQLDPVGLSTSPFTRLRPGAPDRYQYDVSAETTAGRPFELHFHEEPAGELNALTPGLGDLAGWVRKQFGHQGAR